VCRTGGGPYYDNDAGRSGWAAATKSLSGTTLTVSQKSIDGTVKLTQVFSPDKVLGGVKIKMTVANLSAAPIDNVQIARYADIDIITTGADFNDDNGIVTADTATIAQAGFWGVIERAVTYTTAHSVFEVNPSLLTDGQGCATSGVATPVTGDLGSGITYNVGKIGPGGTRSVQYSYYRT
jgi:hypothetical protein